MIEMCTPVLLYKIGELVKLTYRPRGTRDKEEGRKDGLWQWDKLSSKVRRVVFKSGEICLQKWDELFPNIGRVVFNKWGELSSKIGRVVF